MKKAILSLLIISSLCILFAQAPQWEWVQKLEFPADWKFALDKDGNIYMTGTFDSTAVFGNTTLVTQGKKDIFIAKMSKDGNWLWARQSGNSSEVRGDCITLDESGNIIISGNFSGTCNLGETTLIAAGEFDMFIAKLDKDGNWLWATQTGGDSYVGATHIKSDLKENIYINIPCPPALFPNSIPMVNGFGHIKSAVNPQYRMPLHLISRGIYILQVIFQGQSL
jgi:hypothetical protein